MNLQEKYDDLDNIISTIRILKDEIKDKDYIEQLEIIQFQAQNELDEIEPKLIEEENNEIKELERQYWKEVI